jgi:hypothetical protein
MWSVIGNMGVLTVKLLYFSIPLSLIEAFLGSLIIHKLIDKKDTER